MRTILLTNHYESRLIDMLEQIIDGKFELKYLESISREELLEAVPSADYILSSGRLEIDDSVIDRASKLRMIQRTGVGVDRINTEALQKRGIPLYVNAGVNARSVAEYTVMLMLNCLKKNGFVSDNMRNGRWNKTADGIETQEIAEKIVGIVGMGNIGKIVAKMLHGFEAKVLYYSKTRKSTSEEREYHIQYADFEELLKKSDIITLHCPYNSETGCIISENEIRNMKPGVIIINTARGKLIDERAMIDAIKSGKIAGCGIDVFEDEPLPNESSLRHMREALISPHIAGLTIEAYERMFKMAIDNIYMFDKGEKEKIALSLYDKTGVRQ